MSVTARTTRDAFGLVGRTMALSCLRKVCFAFVGGLGFGGGGVVRKCLWCHVLPASGRACVAWDGRMFTEGGDVMERWF